MPDIGDDSLVPECKTLDPRSRMDEPKPEHVFQLQVQLGLIRLLTNHKPEYGLLTYTDCSFWDEIKEFPVRFDPVVFEQAGMRARSIMKASSAVELRPEGVIAGGKECTNCPYVGPCGLARAEAVPVAAVPVPDAEVASMAIAARAARAAAEENERRAREIEADIKDRMRQLGTRKITDPDGRVSVAWSDVRGRPSWDHKGLRLAAEKVGLDLAPFCTVGSPSDRITITVKERET